MLTNLPHFFLSPLQIFATIFLIGPPSSFLPVSFKCAFQFTMIPAQVRCRGCNKAFTPRGLSHHISKTQNMRCRRVNNPLWARFGSPSIPRAASRSSPSPNRIPEAISDDQRGDEYDCATTGGLDDGPDLGEDSSSGASFATCVPNQGRDTIPPSVEISLFFLQLTTIRD
jgi:hypothetical protein